MVAIRDEGTVRTVENTVQQQVWESNDGGNERCGWVVNTSVSERGWRQRTNHRECNHRSQHRDYTHTTQYIILVSLFELTSVRTSVTSVRT
jgi:hypothetical protein